MSVYTQGLGILMLLANGGNQLLSLHINDVIRSGPTRQEISRFTCFTSTQVQILTQQDVVIRPDAEVDLEILAGASNDDTKAVEQFQKSPVGK